VFPAVASAVKAVEERLGVKFKGFRLLTFCPVCVTAYEDALLVNTLEKFFESVSSSRNYSVVGFYVPGGLEQLECTDYRVLVYPVCKECSVKYSTREWAEAVERNILLIRKVVKPVRMKYRDPKDIEKLLEAGLPVVMEKGGKFTLFIPEELTHEIMPKDVFSGKLLGGKVPAKVYIYRREGGKFKFWRVDDN